MRGLPAGATFGRSAEIAVGWTKTGRICLMRLQKTYPEALNPSGGTLDPLAGGGHRPRAAGSNGEKPLATESSFTKSGQFGAIQ